jgi:hypothetical protein
VKNDSSNPDGKIMSIVGIEVERTFQMNGVADAMVKYVCSEAKKAGYECVEAYPNTRGCMDIQTYKHLIKLYENNGFVDEFISGAGRIMRKDLKQSAEEIIS